MFLPDNTIYTPVKDPNLSMEQTPNQRISMKCRLSSYKEIDKTYSAREASCEAHRCFHCPTHWCENKCPAGVPIPEFIARIREGELEEAYRLIRTRSAFPEFCSRVCPQLKQCQSECTRSIRGDAVGIGKLERFVAEQHYAQGIPEQTEPANGKKVAVIGSGPSGLSAAQFLTDWGYSVCVYERSEHVGGLLEYGIPNMKIDKSMIDRKKASMEQQGVRFCTGVDVGHELTLEQLQEEYDAVILAIGTGRARQISPEGAENVSEIVSAKAFLSSATESLAGGIQGTEPVISAKGRNVIIVGGGDTGNDCVGTAIRESCCSLLQLEMLPQRTGRTVIYDPIPRRPAPVKVDSSQEECLNRFCRAPQRYQTTIKSVTADGNGRLCSATLIHLMPKQTGSGRLEMVEVPGTEENVPCELIVVAAGFLGPEKYVPDAFGAELTARGNISTNQYMTRQPGVYACGDCRTGQSLVVKAMVDGRECARAVDQYLSRKA